MKCILSAVIGLLVMTAVLADEYVSTKPVAITKSTNIVVSATAKPFYLTSVLLSMPSGGSNTFSVALKRGSITNVLMTVSATNMTDMVWYVPSRVYVIAGDELCFSNTSTSAGAIIYNSEF